MLFKAVGDHLHISECDYEIILLSLVYWHGLEFTHIRFTTTLFNN